MDRLLPLLVLLLFKFVGGKDMVVVYFANSGATSGTVRVRVNGSRTVPTKAICWNSSWGMKEANVTCRQMGFLKATSTGKVSDVIPPIIFDVRCSGTETNLADCSYSLSGTCQSNLLVSVTCLRNPAFNGLFDVRLNGQAAHNGIVEFRQTYQGNAKQPWYAQCHDLWSKEDSEVVCRQLGYSGVKVTTGISGSLPNVVGGKLKCTGTEQTLRGCSVINTSSCTDKTTYPLVECNLDSETQQPFDIRLTGGNTSAGSVELLKYGKWGVICDKKDGAWNLASARVACGQLGFVDAIRVTEPAEFGQGNGSIHLKNPGCKGDEWSIEKCPIPYGWGGGVNACQTKDTAGVVCSPDKFPAYDISITMWTLKTSKSFGRFFLHSQGFPQLFNYEAQTHHLCTMTSNTIIEFSIYIHYKRFKENHWETLSFQGIDTQTTSSTFYNLQLFGDNSNPGPYTISTKSLTMEFKSNGATGKGKFRLEIRVPNGADIALSCSSRTPTIPSTATTTSTTILPPATSVTSTQTVPSDTSIANTSKKNLPPSTQCMTIGMHRKSHFKERGRGVKLRTQSLHVDVVVGGLFGAIIVAMIAIILGVVLWKLGLLRFGKRQSPRPARATRGYEDTRVEFTGIDDRSAYANVRTEYVNNAFILDGSSPMTDQDATSPYANVRELGQDVSRENQIHLQDPVPEAPYDDVRSLDPNNTAESVSECVTESVAESGSNQSHGGPSETQSHSYDNVAHSEESPYAHLDPVNHQDYLDFKELSPEQMRPI
ncbi:uncharacterized protein LOC135502087 [Lineus longissimus]|uniref:uncharacterized protein LOC135502087 n=1 Tax=Lineus longissimus TaxID=88925 RepID=UPI00315C8F19